MLREMLEPLSDIEEFLREFEPEFGDFMEREFRSFDHELAPALVPGETDRRKDRLGSGPDLETDRQGRSRLQIMCQDVTGPSLAQLLSQSDETTFNTSAEAGNLLDAAARATNVR